jgi:catechol 2,3-dioxygenase-like lactoylglutathione lyase family enzyme
MSNKPSNLVIAVMVLAMSLDRAAAAESRRVVFFGFFLINTSLQPTQPAEEKRLEMLDTTLRDQLAGRRFSFVAIPPEVQKRAVSVNHVALTVSDVQRSFAFYERLFGVTRGWPATDAGTGIHMDLPDGYISIDSVAKEKGIITHFAVAVDHMDRIAAKRLADKINSELPDAKARDSYQANTGGSTVNLRDPDGFFVQISSKDGR